MNEYDLMIILEGVEYTAYEDVKGLKTVGVGFNMDTLQARTTWSNLNLPEDFDNVYNNNQQLSDESSKKLFQHFWNYCTKEAERRCIELNVDYRQLPGYHKFILADIVYNTGSLNMWYKVVTNTNSKDVLYEARRNPKEYMDSRISKIGYYFGIINSIDEAKGLGIKYAKYLR